MPQIFREQTLVHIPVVIPENLVVGVVVVVVIVAFIVVEIFVVNLFVFVVIGLVIRFDVCAGVVVVKNYNCNLTPFPCL